jgi:hypothetical protein
LPSGSRPRPAGVVALIRLTSRALAAAGPTGGSVADAGRGVITRSG